ncbi:MAG TPA: glycosyltransferase [Aliiroseovarius sp.]|nr:glycosyltransferase [Aliiroseovarius sp.]
MTDEIPVSVIVVSRGRPQLLKRCLKGLGQLFYPLYEIIVVTDPDGVEAVQELGVSELIKVVPFDEANISIARNLGIEQAAGQVVAFIDDDAVPEPTWLDHLTDVFKDDQIVAAGGFVRGRNGITFQWGASLIDTTGQTTPLNTVDDTSFAPAPRKHAVKTEGTNCAFRRDILMKLGGFDPAFRFYHDETDLNMRLRDTGLKTAIVPLAQVHHGYAQSDRRTADRVPTSLFEIGASTMVFLRKHAENDDIIQGAIDKLVLEQKARLVKHAQAGRLTDAKLDELMSDLKDGIEDGKTRPIGKLPALKSSKPRFLAYPRENSSGKSVCIAGRLGTRDVLHMKARRHVRAGDVATVYLFSPTTLYHKVEFLEDGFWEQTGGLFGRAVRTEPAFQMTRFQARVKREWRRVARLRQKGKFIV